MLAIAGELDAALIRDAHAYLGIAISSMLNIINRGYALVWGAVIAARGLLMKPLNVAMRRGLTTALSSYSARSLWSRGTPSAGRCSYICPMPLSRLWRTTLFPAAVMRNA